MAGLPQQEVEVERLEDANELAYADVGDRATLQR